jgi:prepilin-type N-terminal cleavage/methylation domain-containing protein/prepilin-type processing-associated H-X9-DG protein
MRYRNQSAFTLIELLVVIAIIAILAAILFPVFAQAKAAAKKASCMSNEKNLALATIMYSTDFDDMCVLRYAACPNTGPLNDSQLIWPGLIQPYAKNRGVFTCTASKHVPGLTDVSGYTETWSTRGIGELGQNATQGGWYWVVPGDPCGGPWILFVLSQLQVPAQSVMYADSVNGLTASGYRGYLARNDALNIAGLAISDRHNFGTNLSLYDGHCKWYKSTAILGNPNAPFQCDDYSVYTGLWWLDKNAARLKWNLTDPCVTEP